MNAPVHYTIAAVDATFRPAVQPLIDESWAGPMIAVNGSLWDTRAMPGFAAVDDMGKPLGYLLYIFHESECEIMVLESLLEHAGVGTRLVERVVNAAKDGGMKKIVVVTTNDNTGAIRFYQKRGFALRALRVKMLETSRRLKPGIPPTGHDGIPIRDEIEFELDV